MPELEGRKFAGCEVISKVGQGGMGAVYKARQTALNRFVALKTVAPQLAQNSDYIARFKQEAAAAGQLNHTGIVQVYAAGEENSIHYILMEFVDGESLEDRLQREKHLDPAEALAICVYVAQALDHAWQRAKLIHRDIKPSNIYLSKTGEVKVGDLGLAKSVGGDGEKTELTQSGMTVGTPHYCSPEQARGSRDLDFRSDIYSIGCMLYHMLSGQRPYSDKEAESPMSVMIKQATEAPPAILKVMPSCPMPVVMLMTKMLAKHPTGRPSSYAELVAELTRAHDKLANPRAAAGPVSSALLAAVTDKPAVSAKKPPVMIYAAAAAAVVIIGGVLVWAPWKKNENASASPAVEQANSPQEKPAPAAASSIVTGGDARPGNSGGASASLAPAAGGPPALQPAVAPIDNPKPETKTAIADPFQAEVAALPVEQQVARVVAKLKELNPGFDGNVKHDIKDGQVSYLAFESDVVKDISPVAALRGLRSFNCSGPAGKRSPLTDLSPLRGLQLHTLECKNSSLEDISVLRGMPLKMVALSSTLACDLSPLAGCDTLEHLYIAHTKVADLSPLKGLSRMERLDVVGAPIADYSVIKTLSLKFIAADFSTRKHLDLLRSLPSLEQLNYPPVAAAEFIQKLEARLAAANTPTPKPAMTQPASQATTTPNTKVETPNPADLFAKEVVALPGDRQVGRVMAKLKEINPGFDGRETHKIEGGAVTELSFSTVGVTDISPVRALIWLKKLVVTPAAANQKGSLTDLAPLHGLPLTWLYCHNNPITDLAPLKGAPLTVLSCGGTQVNDLAPLTAMKLTVLSCNDTAVSDLAALEGMPLTVLWCNNTRAADLAPLKAMPLTELRCDVAALSSAANLETLHGLKSLAKINDAPASVFWLRAGMNAALAPAPPKSAGPTQTAGANTGLLVSQKEQIRRFVEKMKELNPNFDGVVVQKGEANNITELEMPSSAILDISPIRAFPKLKSLSIGTIGQDGSLADISPLKGMRLTHLRIIGMPIADLTPLAGMSLELLSITQRGRFADLSPLKGMRLATLSILGSEVAVADLSPLKGMPLTFLNMGGCPKVNDLSPLKGMRLTYLSCTGSQVSDLTPLKGMPLKALSFHRTKVTDLSVLKGMPLTNLRCDFVPDRDTKLLRSIKTLVTINELPVGEFWKKVAEGEVPQAK